jgi:PAS domain S-box-containing protein
VFAIITIPPVIVLAFAGQLVGAQHATWRSYLELGLITMGVLVVGIPVFGLASPGPSNVPALLLMPLPFLMWAAVRVGVGGTGLTLLTVAGIALANAYVGRGPFINQAPDVNVFSLQIFLTAISIPLLLLAALVEERRQAEESLKQASKRAELALAEQTVQLALVGKAALVGSFAYDIDTEEVQTSQGYAAIHGFPEGTTHIARGQWLNGVHPEDRGRMDELWRRALRDQQGEYGTEYRIVRSGAEVRWIEARCFVSYRTDGSPQRVVGVNIDVTERKQAEDHQRVLVAELDHRVKNVLATVSAVAARTLDTSSSMDQFVAALDGRIRSMATTHELLSGRRWKGIPLAELLRHQLAPYATSSNMDVEGPDVLLSAGAGQTLGIVLHELITNAAKYGALSTHDGRISVRWHWPLNGKVPDRLVIEWQEIGGPAVQVPSRSGHGMEVIRDLVPYELEGTVDLAFASEGVRCRVDIPVSQLTNVDQPGDEFNGSDSAKPFRDSPSGQMGGPLESGDCPELHAPVAPLSEQST